MTRKVRRYTDPDLADLWRTVTALWVCVGVLAACVLVLALGVLL